MEPSAYNSSTTCWGLESVLLGFIKSKEKTQHQEWFGTESETKGKTGRMHNLICSGDFIG